MISNSDKILNDTSSHSTKEIYVAILENHNIVMENIKKIHEEINELNTGLVARLLFKLEEISAKQDKFTDITCGDKTVQSKRTRTNETKKRIGGPRKNILGYIKTEYIKSGWKFFDSIIEDAEDIIEKILDEERTEINKKKPGEARKKVEAAVIWTRIKDSEGVSDEMKALFETHKEDLKREQDGLVVLDASENESST